MAVPTCGVLSADCEESFWATHHTNHRRQHCQAERLAINGNERRRNPANMTFCHFEGTQTDMNDYLLTAKNAIRNQAKRKTKLDTLLAQLEIKGWEPGLTERSYELLVESGISSKNFGLAAVATEIAFDEKPITLRGLMYRVVSAGWLPSTDAQHYNRMGRILTRLREDRLVPFD